MAKKKLNWNELALSPGARKRVLAWVRETCPLIYIYGPSKVGKTTLLGTLLKHPELHEDYCPVYAIDGDQGFATIQDFLDPRTVNLQTFNDVPNKVFEWTCKQLAAAETADCKAIVYEGMTSVHDHMVAKARVSNLGAEGNALRRMHIGPSQDLKVVIQAVRWIKQHRIANGTGVPIFVTLNTRGYPIDPNSPDSKTIYSPSMSKNLIDHVQRGADAIIEVSRMQGGDTYLHVKRSNEHPFVAMRHEAAAEYVTAERNLELPGLLALWASVISGASRTFSKKLEADAAATEDTSPDKQESPTS